MSDEDSLPAEPEGVWVAYSGDNGPYVISIHAAELEALRAAVSSHGHAAFVPFGADFHDTVR